MANNVLSHQPMFAPASEDGFSNDFELDDAFAEYFMSEPNFDTCYTSSMVSPMVSHRRAAVNDKVMMDQTGSTVMDMDQWKPTLGPGIPICLAMGGNKAVFSPENDGAVDAASQQEPPTKKAKQQGAASCLAAEAPYPFENQYHQMFNEYEQFLANPQHTQQYMQQVQQQHDVQQWQHNDFAQQAQTDASVSLPVVGSVGVIWVDVGGTVPLTMQSAPSNSMLQNQYTMKGSGSGAILPGYAPSNSMVQNQYTSMEGSGSGAILPAYAPSTPMSQSQYSMEGSSCGGIIPSYAEVAESQQKKKNREYAKQFRVRTKSMFESLREELASLKKQNQDLRTIVQEHIPMHAIQIIADCSYAANPLSEDTDDIKSTTGADQQEFVEPDRVGSNHAPNPLNVPT